MRMRELVIYCLTFVSLKRGGSKLHSCVKVGIVKKRDTYCLAAGIICECESTVII